MTRHGCEITDVLFLDEFKKMNRALEGTDAEDSATVGIKSLANEQEHTTPVLSLCHGIFRLIYFSPPFLL